MNDDDPLIGQVVLDRYRITKRLGAGGMGAVYLAEHSNMGTQHAAKVMHLSPGLNTNAREDLQGRFLREAKLCASIRHPNMVLVTDFGVHEQSPVLIMDFVKGQDLGEVIQLSGAMAEGEALACIATCASALAEIHRAGVIHRDLKPANLMREAETGRIVLMDLGIAKDIADSGNTTGVLGTPAYMSPEQARDSGTVGPACDIYSLGATLLALLIGRAPVKGTSALEVLMTVREQVFAHGSILGLVDDLHHKISPAVQDLLRDMTRYEPRDRIADADALVKRIQNLLHQDLAVSEQQKQEIAMTLGGLQSIDPQAVDGTFFPNADGVPMQSAQAATGPSSAAASTTEGATPTAFPSRDLPAGLASANGATTVPTAVAQAPGTSGVPMSATPAPAWQGVPVRRKSSAPIIIICLLLLLIAGGGYWVMQQQTKSDDHSNGNRSADGGQNIQHTGGTGINPHADYSAGNNQTNKALDPQTEKVNFLKEISIPLNDQAKLTAVLVAPGTVRVGSDQHRDEQPRVDLQFTTGFYIAQTEITRSQYAQFLSATSSARYQPPGDQFEQTSDGQFRVLGDGQLPVNNVSLLDARAFANWLAKQSGLAVRLPAEAEWEYAARGPAAPIYPWGDRWRPEKAHADGKMAPAAVGSKPSGASWCGAFDMAGNVFEWCDDWFDTERWSYISRRNPQPDPSTDSDAAHVVRGGSYANPRDLCRSAFRVGIRASDRQPAVGFRVLIAIDDALRQQFRPYNKQ